MDGVIVDTEPVHHYAYNQHFKQLNIEVSADMYAAFTGKSTKNIYTQLKETFGLKEDVQTLVETKRKLFNVAFDSKKDLYLLNGVEDLIKDLYINGVQLVVASSSANETINKVFKRFDLDKYFSHKVSGEDFPKSKPDPAIFLQAAKVSETPIENCIIIEDSTNGIKGANSAGIYCIGYKSFHSKGQDYTTANMVISSFDELSFEKIIKL